MKNLSFSNFLNPNSWGLFCFHKFTVQETEICVIRWAIYVLIPRNCDFYSVHSSRGFYPLPRNCEFTVCTLSFRRFPFFFSRIGSSINKRNWLLVLVLSWQTWIFPCGGIPSFPDCVQKSSYMHCVSLSCAT